MSHHACMEKNGKLSCIAAITLLDVPLETKRMHDMTAEPSQNTVVRYFHAEVGDKMTRLQML